MCKPTKIDTTDRYYPVVLRRNNLIKAKASAPAAPVKVSFDGSGKKKEIIDLILLVQVLPSGLFMSRFTFRVEISRRNTPFSLPKISFI